MDFRLQVRRTVVIFIHNLRQNNAIEQINRTNAHSKSSTNEQVTRVAYRRSAIVTSHFVSRIIIVSGVSTAS